ncbi:MAG: PAS domain-containing protein [Methylotetracoccus sp.]
MESCGVGLLGPDLRYLFADVELAAISGSTSERLIGRSVREAQVGWADTLEPLISAALETGGPVAEPELGPVGVVGSLVEPMWKARLSPLQGSSGNVVAVTLVVEPLAGTGRTLSASVVAEWDQNVCGPMEMLAHDFKNRLTPILSAAQMARRYGSEKPEILEWAGTSIESQIRDMAEDLNELIDLAQLIRGQIELRMQEVDLMPILNRVSEFAVGMASKADKRLNRRLDLQTVMVLGDPARLEQAFRRLARYAIESATSEGAVEFSAELDAGQVVIRMGDGSARAMSDEPEWICRPPFDPATSGFIKSGGTAAGLTFAKHLILRHGGRLSLFERGFDRGGAVVIRIPAMNARVDRSRRSVPDLI